MKIYTNVPTYLGSLAHIKTRLAELLKWNTKRGIQSHSTLICYNVIDIVEYGDKISTIEK